MDLLENRFAVSNTVGIYQRFIEKEFEIRVTAIGNHLFASKIIPPDHELSKIDWRATQEKMRLEPFDLPQKISNQCISLMNKLGIVFGCFDFAIKDSTYTLFEVNEMGQFLWMEELCPEIRLLDAFCQLLTERSVDFKIKNNTKINTKNYYDSEQFIINRDARKALHVGIENRFTINE